MGKKSKRNRERISENEEVTHISKKPKLEVTDVLNLDEDYEVFLVKKPLNGHSHYEMTRLPAAANMQILKQSYSTENEGNNRLDVLNFKVEGILSISPSLENQPPSMALDPIYDLPKADDLRQRYQPFGIIDMKTARKKKKHKHRS